MNGISIDKSRLKNKTSLNFKQINLIKEIESKFYPKKFFIDPNLNSLEEKG